MGTNSGPFPGWPNSDLIALYGAVLGTLAVGSQILGWWRRRTKVRLYITEAESLDSEEPGPPSLVVSAVRHGAATISLTDLAVVLNDGYWVRFLGPSECEKLGDEGDRCERPMSDEEMKGHLIGRGHGARMAWLVAVDTQERLHRRRLGRSYRSWHSWAVDYNGARVRRSRVDHALVLLGWLSPSRPPRPLERIGPSRRQEELAPNPGVSEGG